MEYPERHQNLMPVAQNTLQPHVCPKILCSPVAQNTLQPQNVGSPGWTQIFEKSRRRRAPPEISRSPGRAAAEGWKLPRAMQMGGWILGVTIGRLIGVDNYCSSECGFRVKDFDDVNPNNQPWICGRDCMCVCQAALDKRACMCVCQSTHAYVCVKRQACNIC